MPHVTRPLPIDRRDLDEYIASQRRAGHVSTTAAMRYQHAAEERDAEIAKLMTARARKAPASGSVPTGQLTLDAPE